MDNYTNQLLDRVKARFDIKSDYQLAKKLGTGTGRIANWRKGMCSMDWNIAFEIADLLNENDHNVVQGLLEEKQMNPRLINALRETAR